MNERVLSQKIEEQILPSSVGEVQIYPIQYRFQDDPKLGTFISSHKSVVPGVEKEYDIYRKVRYIVYIVDPISKETDMSLATSFSTYSEARGSVEEMAKKAQKQKPLDRFASKEIDGINVLYANTDEEISQGLIGVDKEDFPENTVLVFNVKRGTFHMKGVKFPIDIAFIGKEGRILKIAHMEPELSYASAPAGTEFVAEANLRWFKKNEMDEGDTVSFV